MADYVYRGNQPWNPASLVKDAFHVEPVGRPLKPCGTDAAYRRHLNADEVPCDPCTEAHRARGKAYRPKPRELSPCGTYPAYSRHAKRGEPIDEACAQARRDYEKALKAKKAANK